MICSIDNGSLSARIDTWGAQLISVRSASGAEYRWQRDERYWSDCSPLLFPYIARLYGGGYTLNGRKYEMDIHGFASHCEFAAEDVSSDCVTMTLKESETTLARYPFRFLLSVRYSAEDTSLKVQYEVENLDSKAMPFAIGGHPGFRVPLDDSTEFSDYSLTFSDACLPDRIGFTDELFLSGENKPYPLENGRCIRLDHGIFDDDAIILQNMAKSVTMESEKTRKKLTVSYPDMPYLGLWHMPGTDAPYVCIEPWTSLPSRQGIVEELTSKSDLITLPPGESYKAQWEITITEN